MSKRLTRRIVVIAVVALGVVALGGTALAGHLGEVKSYTGCLVPKDGVIIKVKEGDAPAGPCTGGMQQVHLSGGDITKISVTGALTGGGANGEVTIGLKPEFTLPTGCTSGQVVKWNGATNDWGCARDENTTYSAGTGLDLIGTTLPRFEIEPAYQVKNTPDCSSGQFATGFDSSGNIQCAAPPTPTGTQAYSGSSGAVQVAGQMTIISKTLPAGSYVATAHVATYAPGAIDGEAAGACDLAGDHADFRFLDHGDGTTQHATLTAAISHPGGPLLLTCREGFGDFDVRGASLTAIQVASLG